MTRTMLFYALLAAGPAVASDAWLPEAFSPSDDAVAQAPDDAVAQAPDEPPADAHKVDLSGIRTAFEDALRQVLTHNKDPIEVFPVTVDPVDASTASQLRALLEGTTAQTARLDALSVHWIFYDGDRAVVQARTVVRPGASTSVLKMAVEPTPARPTGPPLPLPGGLGLSWSRAERAFSDLVRGPPCTGLPSTSDDELARIVPQPYLSQAQRSRDSGRTERSQLCKVLAETTWDRVEGRPQAFHFNLVDPTGAMRGGLELNVQAGPTPTLAYPIFKRLPD